MKSNNVLILSSIQEQLKSEMGKDVWKFVCRLWFLVGIMDDSQNNYTISNN